MCCELRGTLRCAGRGACAGATGWSGVCPWVWWLTGWRRAWLGRPRGVSQRSPRPLRSLCARPLPQLSLPSSMRSRTPRPLLLCVLRTHARRPSGRASAPRIASSNAHMACEQPLRRGRGGGHRRPGTTCAPPSDRPALMSPRPARTLARPATARLSLRWGTRRIYPECPGSGDASALSGVGAFRENLGYRNPGGARNDPESQMHGAISRNAWCYLAGAAVHRGGRLGERVCASAVCCKGMPGYEVGFWERDVAGEQITRSS